MQLDHTHHSIHVWKYMLHWRINTKHILIYRLFHMIYEDIYLRGGTYLRTSQIVRYYIESTLSMRNTCLSLDWYLAWLRVSRRFDHPYKCFYTYGHLYSSFSSKDTHYVHFNSDYSFPTMQVWKVPSFINNVIYLN